MASDENSKLVLIYDNDNKYMNRIDENVVDHNFFNKTEYKVVLFNKLHTMSLIQSWKKIIQNDETMEIEIKLQRV